MVTVGGSSLQPRSPNSYSQSRPESVPPRVNEEKFRIRKNLKFEKKHKSKEYQVLEYSHNTIQNKNMDESLINSQTSDKAMIAPAIIIRTSE